MVFIGKKGMAKLALAGVILILGVLIYLPVDFFDEGQSICLSVLLLEQKCYGCGMTRAIHHLIHGDIQGAYNYNKFSFIVLPLALFLIFSKIYQNLSKKEQAE